MKKCVGVSFQVLFKYKNKLLDYGKTQLIKRERKLSEVKRSESAFNKKKLE